MKTKNPIWLCPYWATASLLTMLSVAHIFSCLHNQCSRSVDHFPSFCLANDSYSPAGSSCRCQLAFLARRSTCFFATISETSDEDNNPIWLCPYWATASLLTMLSVAHIFSCLHNQCSRSVDHFPSFCLANDTCSPAGPSCCCQLVLCSKEEHLFLRYDLWNVRWRQKSNLTFALTELQQACWQCWVLRISFLVCTTVVQ